MNDSEEEESSLNISKKIGKFNFDDPIMNKNPFSLRDFKVNNFMKTIFI